MPDNIIRLPYTAEELQTLLSRVDQMQGQWTYSHRVLIQNTQIPKGVQYELSLLDYLPQDGNIYDVLVVLSGHSGANLIMRGDADILPFGGSYSENTYRNTFMVRARQKLIFDLSIQNNPAVWVEVVGYRLAEGQVNQ